MVRVSRWTGVLTMLVVFGLGTARGDEVIPGWGEVIDPDGDCSIKLDGEALVITVPGSPHELRPDTGQKNAPRVVREIEGNHITQVRLSGDLRGSEVSDDAGDFSRTAGILLWLDERNFIRLERRISRTEEGTPQDAVRLDYWMDGRLQGPRPGSKSVPVEGDTVWLRYTRRMDKFTAEVSTDGQDWHEVGVLSVRLSSRLRLGMIATNTSSVPLNARFETFTVKSIPLYPTD